MSLYCVRHQNGWCCLRDQRKRGYADQMPTLCGYVVVLPFGVERREPDCPECETMKTRLTQRRIKAPKRSACGLCKPWKRGGADKKTVRDVKAAIKAQSDLDDNG